MINYFTKNTRSTPTGAVRNARAVLLVVLMAFVGFMAPSADSYMVAAQTAGWDQMTSDCKEKLFPMTIGGGKDEFVTCVLEDKINN